MNTDFDVTAQGIRCAHPSSYIIDRPYGLGRVLLLRFHTPMEVLTTQGIANAEPGQCIVYSPDQPQWYCAREKEWANDWIHIRGKGDSFVLLAARYGVPMNTLLKPGDTRFLPHLFDEIKTEQQQAEAGWQEAVDMLVRQLLLKLGRALRDSAIQFSAAEAEHLPMLRALRWRVHEQLARKWTVGEMASEVGLSASRFAALYQRFFGVSPVEDLLQARIQHARHLLSNRAMPVSAAATQCGFNNVDYFTHVFHQRVGCAPRDYHRRGNL